MHGTGRVKCCFMDDFMITVTEPVTREVEREGERRN